MTTNRRPNLFKLINAYTTSYDNEIGKTNSKEYGKDT